VIKPAFTLIGKRVPFIDSRDKVTGNAVYSMDFSLPGMLYAKILRSPHPHARILRIDAEKARRAPGVRAVITGRDAPDTCFGPSRNDERIMALDEVHYIGHEVAAVLAVGEEAASAALRLIEVEYEPLPAIFDALEAFKPGSVLARLDMQNNIAHHTEVLRGDVEEGFRQAVAVVEADFYAPHQYHAYLEPQAAVAQWKNGRLTVWSAHQSANTLE
jgi:CO/xanthine dehydrogenase Mo-binding subunit